MNPFLAVCFLLVFCGHGPKHHHVAKSHPQVNIVPGQQDARGKSCARITKGFDSWGNQDDWVGTFPEDQQHRVLVCLDEKWKRENSGAK